MSLRTVSAAMVALIVMSSIVPAYAHSRHRDGARHFSRHHAERGDHHRRGYKHSRNWIFRTILSPGTR
jgi:hypothetical protein